MSKITKILGNVTIFICIIYASLKYINRHERGDGNNSSLQDNSLALVSDGEANAGFSETKVRLIPDSKQISLNRETEEINLKLLSSPDYKRRLDKHLRIKLYHQSSASETKECNEIKKIVEYYGLGLEAVYDAYSIAWEYHHETKPKIAGLPDGEFKEMILQANHGKLVDIFLKRYELKDSNIVGDLIEIEPVVFFGNLYTDVSIQKDENFLIE